MQIKIIIDKDNNINIDTLMLQIRHIMLDRDVRQKDICNVTGWSRQAVSNLLAGRTPNPSLRVITQLVNALGCKLYIDIVNIDTE